MHAVINSVKALNLFTASVHYAGRWDPGGRGHIPSLPPSREWKVESGTEVSGGLGAGRGRAEQCPEARGGTGTMAVTSTECGWT